MILFFALSLWIITKGDTDVIGDYGHSVIYRTDANNIEIDWAGGRPTATGEINDPVPPNIFAQGTVNFPDDRQYTLRFYPDENKIYWDGERGSTSKIWSKTTAFGMFYNNMYTCIHMQSKI